MFSGVTHIDAADKYTGPCWGAGFKYLGIIVLSVWLMSVNILQICPNSTVA